jgi:hypothetical protein
VREEGYERGGGKGGYASPPLSSTRPPMAPRFSQTPRRRGSGLAYLLRTWAQQSDVSVSGGTLVGSRARTGGEEGAARGGGRERSSETLRLYLSSLPFRPHRYFCRPSIWPSALRAVGAVREVLLPMGATTRGNFGGLCGKKSRMNRVLLIA